MLWQSQNLRDGERERWLDDDIRQSNLWRYRHLFIDILLLFCLDLHTIIITPAVIFIYLSISLWFHWVILPPSDWSSALHTSTFNPTTVNSHSLYTTTTSHFRDIKHCIVLSHFYCIFVIDEFDSYSFNSVHTVESIFMGTVHMTMKPWTRMLLYYIL